MSYKNKENLEDLYLKQSKSSREIAKELSCGQSTILRWLKRFNIKIRNTSESMIGRKLSEETKRKMKQSAHRGEKSHMWKGDDVKYAALHDWIRTYKPKSETCEICGRKKKLDLSNISGEYKRDINDFQWLCRSCHWEKDKIILNIKKMRV